MRRTALVTLLLLGLAATPAVAAGPAFSVSLSDVPDPAIAGGNVNYEAIVRNVGDAPATDALVGTAIPDGATFVSLSPPPGWTCATPAAGATGAVSCTKASVGAGDEARFGLEVATGQSATDRTLSTTVTADAANAAAQGATATTLVRAYTDPPSTPPDPKPPTVVVVGADPTPTQPAPAITPTNGVTCARVPDLVGRRLSSARRALRRAGCTTPLRVRGPLRTRNVVTSQSARPGAVLRGTKTLTLRINQRSR